MCLYLLHRDLRDFGHSFNETYTVKSYDRHGNVTHIEKYRVQYIVCDGYDRIIPKHVLREMYNQGYVFYDGHMWALSDWTYTVLIGRRWSSRSHRIAHGKLMETREYDRFLDELNEVEESWKSPLFPVIISPLDDSWMDNELYGDRKRDNSHKSWKNKKVKKQWMNHLPG